MSSADLIFGTWPLTKAEAYRAVRTAIEVGYRCIDTAQWYANEAEVGTAIRDAAARDCRITTKVKPEHCRGELFLPSVEDSLRALRVDAVDLLLMHWPPSDPSAFDEAIDLLNRCIDKQYTRAIGVSNCTVAQMQRASARTSAPITVNQVEFHPLLDQTRVKRQADALQIALQGYCSLARGAALGHPAVARIAAERGVSEATVVLRWILQQGVWPVTMSTRRENAAANLMARDLELSATEMAAIQALAAGHVRVVSIQGLDPAWDGPA